jgi:hypothetical protein
MPRLLMVDAIEGLPAELELGTGDVILADAIGAVVAGGSGGVSLRGPLAKGVVAGGKALMQQGGSGAVLIVAEAEGTAEVDIIVGHGFGKTARHRLTVRVGPRRIIAP